MIKIFHRVLAALLLILMVQPTLAATVVSPGAVATGYQNFLNLALSAPLTLSSTTTNYGQAQIMCSSATYTTCNISMAASYWTLPTGTIHATGITLRLSDTLASAWPTNAQIEVDIWSAAPTVISGSGDRTAWAGAFSGTSGWLGAFLCTSMGAQADGTIFYCAPIGVNKDINLGAVNAKVYPTFQSITGSGTAVTASGTISATLQGTY